MPSWLTKSGRIEMTQREWDAHSAMVCDRISSNAATFMVKLFRDSYPTQQEIDARKEKGAKDG